MVTAPAEAALLGAAINDIEYAVLDVMRWHIGRRNKITRDELAEAVLHRVDYAEPPDDMDRQVRKAIQQLRKTDTLGCLICSSSRWQGYWIAESREDVDSTYWELRLKAATMFQGAREGRARAYARLKVRDNGKMREGQMEMFG